MFFGLLFLSAQRAPFSLAPVDLRFRHGEHLARQRGEPFKGGCSITHAFNLNGRRDYFLSHNMDAFERDIVDRLAAVELISLATQLLQNNFADSRDCLASLFRSVALLEMSERIPEVKSLDVSALTSAAQKEDLWWIRGSMQKDFDRLRQSVSQSQKGKDE